MDYTSWLLMREASDQNTEGIAALASGQHDQATCHLNNSLTLLHQILMSQCGLHDLSSRTVDPVDRTAAQKVEYSFPSHDQQDDIKIMKHEIESFTDDRFYIYNQALIFVAPLYRPALSRRGDERFSPTLVSSSKKRKQTDTYGQAPSDYMHVSYFCSIVHFNMALLMHHRLQKYQYEHSWFTDKCRVQAIASYKLCLQNLWMIPTTSPTMNLFMLAAVNNLAHVCLSLPPLVVHFAKALSDDGASKRRRMISAAAATSCTRSLPSEGNYPKVFDNIFPVEDSGDLLEKELVQALLLRAIGKVISNNSSLTAEEHAQVKEMSVNHIVTSALKRSFVAAGA